MRWTFLIYLKNHLKDYCGNCTLVGLSHIANNKLHLVERIFWLISFTVSAWGCYYLISDYMKQFSAKGFSVVYESQPLEEVIDFPSVTVCRLVKRGEYNVQIEELALKAANNDEDIALDVEAFLTFLLYPYDYGGKKMKVKCRATKGNSTICPDFNYREQMLKVYLKCSEFFHYCSFGGKAFDCCRYFLPLTSPYGNCFAMNSFLNNNITSSHWMHGAKFYHNFNPELIMLTKASMRVILLKKEDIAYINLPSIFAFNIKKGSIRVFQILYEHLVNEKGVRDLPINSRKCRFPDEMIPGTAFRAYSFSTCYLDCMRYYQMKVCNCTVFTYLPQPIAKYPDCNREGLFCLDEAQLIKPDASTFVPWSKDFKCECLPSCNEGKMQEVYDADIGPMAPQFKDKFGMIISMLDSPSFRFRRLPLRAPVDIVITIGGVMGLFLGASLLSAVEFIYYFTIRMYNCLKMRA